MASPTKFIKKILKRYIWGLLSTIILLIIIFFAIQKQPKILDGNRIKIIDKIGENYLIRGSNPFSINTEGKRIFDYPSLKKYIKQSIENKGFKTPEDFYLIDISLLNLDAYFQIHQEQEFFKNHPQLGEVKNYSEISPLLLFMPLSQYRPVNHVTLSYHHNLDQLIASLHQQLSIKNNSKPKIIYVHCNAGRDRTGVISAGYRMRYQNMNLRQALQNNIDEVGRNPESLLYDALVGYCNYLKQNFQKPDNFCEIN